MSDPMQKPGDHEEQIRRRAEEIAEASGALRIPRPRTERERRAMVRRRTKILAQCRELARAELAP